jgi:hypothetical protein
MAPKHLAFGGGVAESIVNPFVLAAVLLAGVLILFGSRKSAIAAFLLAGILVPTDQVLVLGALHFPMLRVLAVFGFARMAWSKINSKTAVFSGGVNGLDKAVIGFAIFTCVDSVLLWHSSAMLIKQLGDIVSLFGTYFLCRLLIREEDDVVWAIRVLGGLAIFFAGIMCYEVYSGHNPYGLLGGARAALYTSEMSRDGRVRAVAGFVSPITAGTFGAVLVPVFVALWWHGKNRLTAAIGVIAGTIITLTSASATPLMALMAGILGLCLWPARKLMRLIRWGIVFMLVGLDAVMKAPVWQLIARVDVVGGSSGDHRYQLINQFIRHFWNWFLIGTRDNASWGWDMWDTANWYVGVGESGGLLAFICFIAIIVYGFKYLGRARNFFESENDKKKQLFLWGLSSAMFANLVAFFGISLFDQTMVSWYAYLAIISAAAYAASVKFVEGRTAAGQPVLATPAGRFQPQSARVSAFSKGIGKREVGAGSAGPVSGRTWR